MFISELGAFMEEQKIFRYRNIRIPHYFPITQLNDMLQNLDTLIQLYKNNTFYENNIPYLKTLQHENKSYQIIIAKDELE